MEVDKFTKTYHQKENDEVAMDDFKVDFSAAQSIFSRNPLNSAVDPEKEENSQGFFEFMFEKFEEYLDKNKKNSPLARKLKMLIHFFQIKDTLSRLNKINSSVDELVNLKVPFGEQQKRYEILSNRLIRANYLHSQIKKELS